MSKLRTNKEVAKITGNPMITVNAEVGTPRNETFNGREHLVVPLIMLVEGVIQGMQATEPELALSEEFSKSIRAWDGKPVVHNHPRLNGELVSANIPVVYEENTIGMLFNTTLDNKKLKSEAWIDLARAEEIGDETWVTVQSLQGGEVVEVSTGLFSAHEVAPGVYNGESYTNVWRNIQPDHLAILPAGTIGACSVSDGCGANRTNSAGCGCKECEEKAEPEVKSLSKQFKENILNFLGRGKLSDDDVRRALQTALDQKGYDAFVMAVYAKEFIFEHYSREDGSWGTYRKSFDISKGVVNIGDEMDLVRPETKYVSVKTNEELTMEKKELVDKLIGNESSPFGADDADKLMTFSEDVLNALLTTHEQTPETPEEAPEEVVEEASSADEEVVANAATFEDLLNSAPAGVRESIEHGQMLVANERKSFIERIKANTRNPYTDAALEAMSFQDLSNLAAFAEPETNYQARLGVNSQTAAESNLIPLPAPIFSTVKEG